MNRYCCQGSENHAKAIDNRPGLTNIGYRLGTYTTFLEEMLAAIASAKVRVDRETLLLLEDWTARDSDDVKTLTPLKNWTARDSDDLGIALFEMWAYLADILTFYQERTANEAFLRTALHRESVLRLAALLNYRPAPGAAAAANLAFAVKPENTVNIPIGLRVQSVPGQDEKPQKFEVGEELLAKPELNCIRVYPEPEEYFPLLAGSDDVVATSDVSHLASGDNLVIFEDSQREDKKISQIAPVEAGQNIQWTPSNQRPFSNSADIYKWTRKLRLFGRHVPEQYFTAPDWKTVELVKGDWDYEIVNPTSFHLDAVYDDLTVGTEILISAPGVLRIRTINSVSQEAAQLGPHSSTATRIDVSVLDGVTMDLREVTIYELSGPGIDRWLVRYPDSIPKSADQVFIPLQDPLELEVGRTLLLDDKEQDPVSVTVTGVEQVDADKDNLFDHTAVSFSPEFSRELDSKTAVLYGNVAEATHGESLKPEVLGSGDAAAVYQSFAMKTSPVTFVRDILQKQGVANSLELRVDNVLWQEVGTLLGRSQKDSVYTTSLDNDGVMSIQFGDGDQGAILPTGRNNVVATYRQGLGTDGNVKARAITNLLDRPLGLKKVFNPAPALGGADPETLDEARQNAPSTVRTFGRIVSMKDFEDAAREYIGIAKATASCHFDGEQRAVLLTVACDEDADLGEDLKGDLRDTLDARRDPNRKLIIEHRTRVECEISAVVETHPDYLEEQVCAAADAAVRQFLAFENVALGQSLHLSDFYRVLQQVEGVVAARVVKLGFPWPPDTPFSMYLAFLKERGVTFLDYLDDPDNPEAVQNHLYLFPGELARLAEPADGVIVSAGMVQP